MKVETLLPLGKTDPGLRTADASLDISRVSLDAKLVEELGYDSLVVEETKDDPYIVMALAAQATSRLAIATSVAMAFPRSPTVTAMTAWTLQKLSNGRFTLGLGSQVRGHIVRRFGLQYSPPAPWMREYVQAVRAVWKAWQNREALNFEGERYKLNLMAPLFDPGPIENPNIPIHVAAVNRGMARVAGEVADGVRLHPVCTPEYIDKVTLPAIAEGAARAGRRTKDIDICMKPLVATAPDSVALELVAEDVRARVAFYASTPSYRAAFSLHGLGGLADELCQLSKQRRWEEMPGRISDSVLETYAVVGTYDDITEKLLARYGGLVDRVEFGIPANTPKDKEILSGIINDLRLS